MLRVWAAYRAAAKDLHVRLVRTSRHLPGAAWLSRHWVAPLAFGCVLAVLRNRHVVPADAERFAAAGSVLWSPRVLDAFADRWVQAGPAELSFFHLVDRAEQALGIPAFQLASALQQVTVVFGTTLLAALPYRLRGRSEPPGLLLAVGLTVLVLGLGSELHAWGHPAQFAITALWMAAVVAGSAGRGWAAGLALAAAALWEPWGVLGVPLLLVLRTRDRIAAAAVMAGAVLVSWGPFVLLGDFAMGAKDWRVQPSSLPASVLGPGTPFGWELRLVQSAVVLLVGAVVVRALDGHPHLPWAGPLAILATRLLTDPRDWPYYAVPLQVLMLVAVAFFVAHRDDRALLVLPLLYGSVFVEIAALRTVAACVLSGVMLLAVLTAHPSPCSRSAGGVPNVTLDRVRWSCYYLSSWRGSALRRVVVRTENGGRPNS